jgi:hypothetical protein
MFNEFVQIVSLAATTKSDNISEIARQAFLRVTHRRFDPDDALNDPDIDEWLNRMEESLRMKRLNDVNPMIFINGWILEDIDEVDFFFLKHVNLISFTTTIT